MTLIVSHFSPSHVLQLSDRLLSQNKNGVYTSYDVTSNKTLIYLASNGALAMSYSGIGFLNGVTTDQWIAEKLVGVSFGEHPRKGEMGLVGVGIQHLRDTGNALRYLSYELTKIFSKERIRQPLVLSAVGWQLCNHRKRIRPVGYCLKNATTNVPKFAIYPVPRTIPSAWSVIPQGQMNLNEKEKLHQKRKISGDPYTDGDIVEQIAVDIMSRVAKRNAVVGSSFLSILIPRLRFRQIRIKFISEIPQPATAHPFVLSFNSNPIPATYLPWILGPQNVHAPAQFGMDFKLGFGDWEIAVEGSCQKLKKSGTLPWMTGQPRRNWPD